MGKHCRYGVVFDAGSSGTRVYVYRWLDPASAIEQATPEDLRSLPRLETQKSWSKKIKPGISSFNKNPADIGESHLEQLVDHVRLTVPEPKIPHTPIFLMATAGMRLLPDDERNAILSEICNYLKAKTNFLVPDCDLHVQVITGETEGLLGWLASNYLIGALSYPMLPDGDYERQQTYGFLDMGGASAQVAFEPNVTETLRHPDDVELVRLRTLDGTSTEHRVYTTTWLGLGANQARKSYLQDLQNAYPGMDEIYDPCLPRGLRTTIDGKHIRQPQHGTTTLTGTGQFEECLDATRHLLDFNGPCMENACLLTGQDAPEIDYDVNHFIGVSEYWWITHGIINSNNKQPYDYQTYVDRVNDFCSQSWQQIKQELGASFQEHTKDTEEACFKASWLLHMLYEGIGIPKIESGPSFDDVDIDFWEELFQPVKKIHGMEVSWTLGKMVLYAAAQVPARSEFDDLPVGFGSNVPGIPPDFEFSKFTELTTLTRPDEEGGVEDEWAEGSKGTPTTTIGRVNASSLSSPLSASSTSSITTSGSAIFAVFTVLILVIALFFRKKEWRARIGSTFSSFVHGSRHGSSASSGRKASRSGIAPVRFFRRNSVPSDRAAEEGEARKLGLGNDEDASSSDQELSGSGGVIQLCRSSGLSTPKMKLDMFDAPPPGAGSALDRGGLVGRTESRERLSATFPSLAPHANRSRTRSPARRTNSPLLPMPED